MRPFTIVALCQLCALSTACIRYRGTMPFDDKLPFEATIEENNKPLCWMKTTYEEHNLMQILANEYMNPEERRREWRGQGDENTWGFRRWEMTCVPNVKGWVNVGLRTIGVLDTREVPKGGKKRDLGWVTEIREDFWGARWTFTKDLNCDPAAVAKDQEKIKEAAVKKLAEEKAYRERMIGRLSVEARRKEEAKDAIRAVLGAKSMGEVEGGVKVLG